MFTSINGPMDLLLSVKELDRCRNSLKHHIRQRN